MQQPKINQQRIGLVASTILIVVVLLVGVMVFYIMSRHAERLLSDSLQSSLQNHAELTQFEIKRGTDIADSIANRPLLLDQMQRLNRVPNEPSAIFALQRAAQAFLSPRVSAIAFYDQRGRVVVSAGRVVAQPDLEIPLKLSSPAQLIWQGGFLLRSQASMRVAGVAVGRVLIETPLPAVTEMVMKAGRWGKTRELAVCGSAGLKMQCFPMALNPKVYTLPRRSNKGVRLPMAYALEGQTGFIIAEDYRHQKVVAAFSPMGKLGLGMVLKMDSAELYAPVWDQLRYLLPLLAGMMALALLLLRWQLTPLVTGLVRSERKAREAFVQLQNSENRVQAVLDNVDEGIVTISASGKIELFNPGAERMFGYRSREVLGKNVSMLMPEPYHNEHDGYLAHYMKTGDAHIIGTGRELSAQRSNGEIFPMELRVSEFHLDGQRQFIGIMRDITARKATEAKIIHLAHFDALTNLPNRRLVQDRIQQAIVAAQRTGAEFAVLFIDLDKFKDINDTHGHDVGDRLLEMVAQRLTESLRAQDTVGRQGGDEFIVLLASLSTAEDSARVAQKILDALSAPFELNGQNVRSGASIGIAVYPHDGTDVATLLKNSDTAMYSAKGAGRSNYQFFASAMNEASAERLLLEGSLRHAIEHNELVLHFQSLVNIASGNIVATEALVRWNHPQLGQVGPTRFIPVAEESGLIVPLGEWVLRRACSQLMQWREQGVELPRMVVNLSPRQFRQKHLLRNFYRVLSETGVDPHWLGLEITENVIMDNPEISIAVLQELKALGFELSLDDFGTGYSSLSYLKRLPIDKLKIDQSFVRGITTDVDDEAMVTAIIVMAHQLEIVVVAEGVETEEQLNFLRAHGCDEYQGFYFDRPMPPNDLLVKLTASSAGKPKIG